MAFPDGIKVDCIDSERSFAHLREEWNRLARTTRGPGVFLRHEWFDAAWRWRREDSELSILRIHDGTRTIGIVPLMRRRSGRRCLVEFLSVPDTQFCDLVCADSDRDTCTAAAGAYLARHAPRWDTITLRYLAAASPTAAALPRTLAPLRIRTHAAGGGVNPYVDLAGAWHDFYGTCSRRLKKANNLAANRLRRAGGIRLEWFRPGSVDRAALDPLLADITAISARSWKGKTPFSLDHSGPGAFLRRLSEAALEHGWLSVWVLYLSDHPVAMEYQLVNGGSVYALRADFDGRYAELSPGAYLNWKILEGLFGRGLERYYMGPGDNAYKLRWTDRGERMIVAHGYAPSLRGRVLAGWNLDIKPRLRRLRTWVPRGARRPSKP